MRIVALAQDAGLRLDQLLRKHVKQHSRAAMLEWFREGRVRVAGRRAIKSRPVRPGDVVELIDVSDARGPLPNPALPLHVLYEDAAVLAVDKPAGMATHALRHGSADTLASALLARYPRLAAVGHSVLEPGIVHRLDTETSGVVLCALDPTSFAKLRAAHERRELDKRYIALCVGAVPPNLHAHAFLRADRRKVRVRTVPFSGYQPIDTEILGATPLADLSLVTVRARFAARHQVRAHLAALGHPIVSDALYGGPALPGLPRHFLHASEISFPHPASGASVTVSAPLPDDLRQALAAIA